jgi:hypothetical protein
MLDVVVRLLGKVRRLERRVRSRRDRGARASLFVVFSLLVADEGKLVYVG